YNQIAVDVPDQHKKTFTTPWGTFSYKRIPFGLIMDQILQVVTGSEMLSMLDGFSG
ncbi:hypothetical protein KI387_027779, partial [Taxus chinensis]